MGETELNKEPYKAIEPTVIWVKAKLGRENPKGRAAKERTTWGGSGV